jgi:putative ABC transport system permease protein
LNRAAVLGSDAENELFPNEDPLNKKILIGNVPFQVIGVLNSRGAGPAGGSLDNLILIPVTTASRRLFNRDFLTMVIAQLKTPQRSSVAIKEITSLLRRRHRLAPSAMDDFTITDPRAVMKQLLQVGSVLNKTLMGVSIAAMILGGVVIMALMLMGVTERRREIGIRRSIGASRSDITAQFLLEAVLISVVGGLAGIALGSSGVNLVASMQRLPFVFSIQDLAFAAGLSAAVGLIFGIYPAWRAARVDPVLALRS